MQEEYVARPRLSFTGAIKSVFGGQKFLKGRARRSEFWWYRLLTSLVEILFIVFLSFYTTGSVLFVILCAFCGIFLLAQYRFRGA